VKIVLSDKTKIDVELTEGGGAFDTQAGLGHLKDKEIVFQDAMRTGGTLIKDAVESIQSQLLNNKPDSLELQVGLKLGAEGNLIVSKGTAEAAVSIKATWQKEQQ
jgi:hypothetical protein